MIVNEYETLIGKIVIGTSGKLTGYAGGLDIKEKLLDIETTANFK
ncbi:MAG: hypothetical protein PHD15_03555 [Clostridia bacterium]|nr:hypothetical protein [Clostridia bacterium]MDD4386818.1 hypothetical protein [Clostridia bacterium]